jgi:hypothetical protein
LYDCQVSGLLLVYAYMLLVKSIIIHLQMAKPLETMPTKWPGQGCQISSMSESAAQKYANFLQDKKEREARTFPGSSKIP